MSSIAFFNLAGALFHRTNDIVDSHSLNDAATTMINNDTILSSTTTEVIEDHGDDSFSTSIALILIALTCTELLIMALCKLMAWYAHMAFYSQFAGHSSFEFADQPSPSSFSTDRRHEEKHINKCLKTRTYHPVCDHCSDTGDTTSYASECSIAEEENTCPICLLNYEDGDIVSTGSKCEHLFHKDCISQWLEKHSSCPCCRSDMLRLPNVRRQERENNYGNDAEDNSDDNNDDTSSSEAANRTSQEGCWAIFQKLFTGDYFDTEFCLFLF
mmetsp:Transcript_7301/g.11083  ORF Transcript_7301/g.11083 Transcript_7301/m.11083 type:complete len:271 (+) Transcript_7301:237-1049(+)